MGIKDTKFWEWYKGMYQGPDGDFHGMPEWHGSDMFDAWCAALSYADKKGHEEMEEIGEAVDNGDFVEVMFKEDTMWFPGEKVYRMVSD